MSIFGQTFKSFIIAGSFTSIVLMAGTYLDKRINTNEFMHEKSVELISRLDDTVVRNVASLDNQDTDANKIFLKFNQTNRNLIEGAWEITSIMDESSQRISRRVDENGMLILDEDTGRPIIELDDSPAFNEEGQTVANEGTYKFELIGDDRIQIADDLEQADWEVISYDGNKIALQKWIEKGYEVIEARKVIRERIANNEQLSNKGSNTKAIATKEAAPALKVNRCFVKAADLRLSNVLNFAGNNRSLIANENSEAGPLVSGSIEIVVDAEQEFAKNLEITVAGKPIVINELSVTTCVFHAGHEDDDDESFTGVIRKYGSGYTFNFSNNQSNKELKGAVLTFVSDDEFAKIKKDKEERELAASEIPEEEVPDLSSGVKEGKVTTRQSDDYTEGELEEGQSISDKVEEIGYEF